MKSAFALIKLALVFIMGFFVRKSGKDAILSGQAKDAAKRSENGRQAAGKAHRELQGGKSPDDVVDGNSDKW